MSKLAKNRLLLEHVRAACTGRTAGRISAAALLGLGTLSTVLASPTGGVVVDGRGTISTPAPGTTVIDQASQHVQLNWNTFDVGANESVQFHQPSSSSVALNRILDQNPSQIFGSIEANGQVVLVNPNGLLFGHSAQLNVGSLVASSLEVTGFDAATGRYTFGTSRTDPGAVINDGRITAASGGSVTLLGGYVSNTGSIVADFGTVNLAAGRTATVDLAGDGLLQLEVDADLLANATGANAAVENSGSIQANGGRVLLTAQAVDGVFANLVNNTGAVRANRIDNSGGAIRLLGEGGTVRSSGTLDASAGDSVSDGGTVEVLGERVGLFGSAVVDVSGAANGGTALIGGDYQGMNADVPNAARTYVGADAVIKADAGARGDGGRVIVWADEHTRFDGHVSARAGEFSGNGGFAEVSGKQSLVFTGTADLSAAHGARGTLLLDPDNIVIDDSATAPPELVDDGTYEFADDPADATVGNQTIESLLADGTNVVLQANVNIVQNAGADIDVSAEADAAGQSLTLQAGNDIQLNGNIVTNNGAVTLDADNNIDLGGNVTTGGGSVMLDAGNDIDLSGTATTDGGSVTLEAGNDIVLGGTVTTGDGTVSLTAAGGSIDMQAGSAIDAGSGIVTLTAAQNVGIATIATSGAATVTATAGSITDDDDDATRVAADTLELTAGTAIGASTANGAIDTDVASLTASAGNGGVYVAEADGLTLDASATDGAVDVQTDSGALDVSAASGTGVTLVAGGAGNDVTLNGVVNSGAGDVTLTAGGAIVAGGGNQVTGDALSAIGTAIGASGARLNTTVASLDATSTSGGIFITETNALNLTANATGGAVDVQTSNGLLTVTGASGDGVTLTAGGGGNGITLNGAVNAGTGNVALTAGTVANRGAIVAGAGSEVSGNTLTATGASIGTGGARLNTNVASLNATTSTGDIFVTEADALDLTADAGGTVNVQTTNGSLTANTVGGSSATLVAGGAGSALDIDSVDVGTGAANLTAGGAITDGAGGSPSITAGALTLSGASVGSAANRLGTQVASLSASATNGSIYVTEQNGLTLATVAAAGVGSDVDVTSTTGNIVVGSIDAPDAVTLTAAGGAILDDGNDATAIAGGNSISLSAATTIGTVVDFVAESDAAVGSSVDVQTSGALSASVASNTGAINLNLSGTPTLAAGAIALGSGTGRAGAIVLQSSGDLNVAGLAAGAIDIGSGNSTSVGLRSGGVLTLPAGGGFTDEPAAELLVRGATDVVDNDASPRELSFAATALDFRSGAAGGSTTLDTTVGRLDATIGNGQDLTVNQTGNLTLGTVSAVGGNVSVSATGSIADDGDDLTRIVADTATLSGTALGAAGNQLDTQVDTLGATATSGGAYIREVDGLNLTAAASGAVDVQTGNGSLTVASASGNGVTLTAGGAGSGIALDGAVNAGAGNVTLTAGTAANRGAIVAGAGSQITGNALSATGSAIGSSAARLSTTVASLDATSTGGGIYVSETNALDLTASATGAVDVQTVDGSLTVDSANGNGVTLGAGGAGSDITLNGVVNAGAGNVTLTAGTAASRGAIVAGAGNQVIGNALVANGSAIGSSGSRLNTSVSSLNGTATNGGMFVSESDALALTANATGGAVDVRTSNGALAVAAASGNGVTLGAGGAGNSLTLNGAVDAGTGDVGLTAGGAIVAGAGNLVSADALTTSGSSLGSSGARLNTDVSSLNATSSNGGIFVTETDALALTANATGGAVDVRTGNGSLTVAGASGDGVALTAGGAGSGITLNGTVDAGAGDVALTAGTAADRGTITAGAGSQIVGNAFTGTAASLGSSGARLNTTVSSITANASNGGIFITEANALTLSASATGGAVDVRTTNGSLTVAEASGDDVVLAAGGSASGMTLNGIVDAVADVTLTSGGAVVAGTGSQVSGDALTVTGASVGSSDARLNTAVSTLTATGTGGGVYITEQDGLNLTASASAGALDVQTIGGSIAVAAATGEGITLTAGGAGSGITLNGALNAGNGDVTLTAGTAANRGAITAGAGSQITAGALIATASGIGTSGNALNTSIETLTATASNGGVYINEQDGLTLLDVSAAGAGGDVSVTSAGGDIFVGTVAAQNAATLTAAAGAIADDGDDSTRVTAESVTLHARSLGAPSVLTGRAVDSTARLDIEARTLQATATAGGIFIDEFDGLERVDVQAEQDIELLSRGDLNLFSVEAGDTLLLAAGGNIFALPGASAITAQSAELRAGAADPDAGHIGTLTQPIELELSAGNSLDLYVPQTVDPDDPDRAPVTLPSAGVNTTLHLFAAPSTLAVQAGFGQFQGSGDLQFTSPAEALLRTLQSQTGTVQAVLDIDWASFDPNVSLFGTLEPAVCLPGDQRDEEVSTPEC